MGLRCVVNKKAARERLLGVLFNNMGIKAIRYTVTLNQPESYYLPTVALAKPFNTEDIFSTTALQF